MTLHGVLLEGNSGKFSVLTDDGVTLCDLSARGNLRKKGSLLTGDRVEISEENGCGIIETYAPRKNALIRPPMANLDVMFVTFAVCDPEPDYHLIDKMLCICAYNAITPVLVVTKTDLNPEKAEEIKAVYAKTPYTVLLSSKDDDKSAVSDYFAQHLKGKISAFAGCSGVGKSTLLNALFPHLNLKSDGLSERIMRGKNTTRLTTLYPVEIDGERYLIADTPGFSFLDFEAFDFFGLDDLFDTFPEFSPYLGRCRYTDCSHTQKETECALKDAVKDGTVARSRYDSYCTLYAILKQKEQNKYKS